MCAAALALGSTAAMAQTVSETPVASPEGLTDGYYVIKATSNDGSCGGGYVYYNPEAGGNRLYRVGGSGTSYGEGQTAGFQYVWKLTNNETPEGTFTLQNAEHNTFIPADQNHNLNLQGTETANLKVEVCDEEGDRNGKWYITMDNYQHSGQSTYWCLNAPEGDANLSYWEGQNNAAVVFVEFYSVEMPAEIAYDADYAATVEANLGKTGVGYPVAGVSTRQPLAEALAAYKEDGANDNLVAVETFNALASAYNDYLLSETVQMPEDGKAYTFTFVGSDAAANEFYLNYDATNDQIVAVSRTEDAELPESARFIARHVDGDRYLFALPSGKYLVWKGGSNAGTNSDKGVIDAYDETFAALTLEHARSNNGSHMTAGTAENLFGLMTAKGIRSNGTQVGYFLLNNNTSFNRADQPYFDGSITSCFRIEEAPAYYNTVTLRTADGYAYSTVYLPFAVDVPQGVEAFTGSLSEGEGETTLRLTSIADGVIPARTAVVLRGTTDGSLALVPATATGTAVEANALQGTLDASATTPENTYALSGAFDEGIGFYPYSAAYLPAGKAYLTLTDAQAVQKLAFSFGQGTTGIDAIEAGAADKAATWYDLSGRRVDNPTKGVYIVNGKKVIVK